MTVPRITKANALRERHVSTLKKAIETALTLTAEACQSTINVYSQELEESWKSYCDAFNEHEDSLIGKESHEGQLQTIQNEYLELKSSHIKAKIKIGKLSSPANLNSTAHDFNTTLSDQSSIGEQVKTFKLPPIQLPTISGDPSEWVEFKATCRAILTDKIHDVQRLQQLKKALVGEPRGLVAHVLPGDGAYDQAMLVLKRRYENSRSIVNSQLQQLYVIPANEPSRENVATLKAILNTLHSLPN